MFSIFNKETNNKRLKTLIERVDNLETDMLSIAMTMESMRDKVLRKIQVRKETETEDLNTKKVTGIIRPSQLKK